MKRIVTLLLAAGLVFGAYTGAQAADVKVSGEWIFGFNVTDNLGYAEGPASGDNFNAMQRLRLQLNVIASENLQGVVFFEMGNQMWGDTETGGQLGADGTVVEVKRSYIDWTVPNTDLMVRMGIQGLALPGAAFGSPIFDDDVAALTLSYPVNDNLALTAFWARPYDGNGIQLGGYDLSHYGNDEMDMFGLIAPITLDGHSITPYFVYSKIGKAATLPIDGIGNLGSLANSIPQLPAGTNITGLPLGLILDDDIDAYWAGIAYSMTAFDPFRLDVDVMYGSMEMQIGGPFADQADSALPKVDMSGWLIDFKASYALDFMTPALIGWYASGVDLSDLENMLEVADSTGSFPGSLDIGLMPNFFLSGAGNWGPTSFGYAGSCYDLDSNISAAPLGTWALGIELADISFIEDLTHVFRFVYMQGTNDLGELGSIPLQGYTLLDKNDSAIEINLDSKYQIYDNFAVVLELGYIKYDIEKTEINQMVSQGLQQMPMLGLSAGDEAAYKAALNFIYTF